jgi:ferrous iron transport protein B
MMGFGCTVPALMATRTLENKRIRYLTVLLTPFISCGAKVPVYTLFIAAFFAKGKILVIFSLYVIGILVAVLMGLILKALCFAERRLLLLSNFLLIAGRRRIMWQFRFGKK